MHSAKSFQSTHSVISNFDEVVTIIVGKEKQTFFVHKDLLVRKSKFFAGALRGDWKEARDQQICLLDEEPYIFRNFVNWLYTGTAEKKSWNGLCRGHILAEKLLVPEFANANLLGIVEVLKEDPNWTTPPPATCNYVWETADPSSPLRDILIDVIIWEGPSSSLDGVEDMEIHARYQVKNESDKGVPANEDPADAWDVKFDASFMDQTLKRLMRCRRLNVSARNAPYNTNIESYLRPS